MRTWRKELLFSTCANAKLYSFLEDGWVVSYKAKHTLTIWSGHCPPWYLPKYVENLCPPKSWRSFIHNRQKLITIICSSVGEWINRLWDILTIEYYLAIKRNEWSIHEKTLRSLKFILPVWKSYIYIVSAIGHSGKGKRDSKKVSGCQGFMEGGVGRDD